MLCTKLAIVQIFRDYSEGACSQTSIILVSCRELDPGEIAAICSAPGAAHDLWRHPIQLCLSPCRTALNLDAASHALRAVDQAMGFSLVEAAVHPRPVVELQVVPGAHIQLPVVVVGYVERLHQVAEVGGARPPCVRIGAAAESDVLATSFALRESLLHVRTKC